uniref:Tonsoku-like protein n=1 Tax=Strix occidentalis caurina TaxID=311401 RepID=A0A8D0FJA8_STROC
MRSRLYLNLGLVYDSLKEPAKCDHYIKKSIFLSEQGRLYEDLYRAYFNLGHIQLREGEHSAALRCLARARDSLGAPCADGCPLCHPGPAEFGGFCGRQALAEGWWLWGSLACPDCHLPTATKVTRLQEALEEAAASDPPAALALCEQLGDTFSKHGDYARAVDYYQKQLSFAQELGRPAEELAIIHVSLATTFGDLKEHARAVHHYRQELALHQGNALEVSWGLGGATGVLGGSLDALGGSWVPWEGLLGPSRGSWAAAGTAARLGGSGEEEEEEEEEPESSEAQDESELELSESGEEGAQGGFWGPLRGVFPHGGGVSCRGGGRGTRRLQQERPRAPWNRRNERGETPLHRACIEGDLRRVQLFLRQGHPLNPRDYCGWTPLHEACNHGHLEIVRLLLDRGAALDDPGGPGCEGITPLHDALSCGHFEVAELLVRRGASVTARNAKVRWKKMGWGGTPKLPRELCVPPPRRV